MQWSMELSQYEIRYLLRVAIKGQVVVDFITKLMPNEEGELPPDLSSVVGESLAIPHPTPTWDLYVDGSSSDRGCGVDLILNSSKPEHLRIEYVLRLGFKASNNKAEHEVLLAGLRLA